MAQNILYMFQDQMTEKKNIIKINTNTNNKIKVTHDKYTIYAEWKPLRKCEVEMQKQLATVSEMKPRIRKTNTLIFLLQELP